VKKRRVCIVNLYARALFSPPVDAPFGGSEVQVTELARELSRREEWDISFATGDYGQPDYETLQGIEFFKSIKPGQTSLWSRAINTRKYWSAFKQANADIYLVTCDFGALLWRLSLFCRRYNKILVNRISSNVHCQPDYLKQHPVKSHFYLKALRRCDLVVTQNAEQQRNLSEHYGIASEIIRSLAPPIGEIAHRDKREYVLWVGKARDIKRPDIYVELAQGFPETQFIMILGKYSRSATEKVRNAAQQVQNLRLIEEVPKEDMSEYYRNALMLVNTSDFEGFPSSFVEACSVGTPLLSLRVDPDGILSRQGVGIMANSDMESLRQGLQRLLEDDIHWQQCHEKALTYVRENHDPVKVGDRYSQLFLNMLDKGSKS
jgi:glycosyltransferase involved in cell wall biosynthesis